MQHKVLFATVAVMGIIGATALVSNIASAHGLFGMGKGGQQVDDTAEILGLDADALRSELETKDLRDIVEEQGLTQEEFHAKMLEQLRTRLSEQGLSEDEINQRVSEAQTRYQSMLQTKADILGISVDELQKELESKGFPELLDQYGISHVELHEKMRAAHQADDSMGHGFGHPRGRGPASDL